MSEHTGHRQRMRQRFRENGLSGFASHEVLELILFYAIPQRNVNPLAHSLLERFGSLQGVLEADMESLSSVEGMGEYAATLLTLFAQVGRRLESERGKEKRFLSSSGEAATHCVRLLSGLRQEHFYVICLSAGMEWLGDSLIAKGSLGEVNAYPRSVAEAVLRLNAHTVILTHNHPGGSCRPTPEDAETTRRIAELLSSMQVRLADHIIVSGESSFSFAEEGLLPEGVE